MLEIAGGPGGAQSRGGNNPLSQYYDRDWLCGVWVPAGVDGLMDLWDIARVNGLSYCGSDEQVSFLKSLCNNCETKPSDEVEGATLYDYSKKLGKSTSTERARASS